jgi:hypothetical protein
MARGLVPLGLAAALIVVVVLAALRGGGADPELVSGPGATPDPTSDPTDAGEGATPVPEHGTGAPPTTTDTGSTTSPTTSSDTEPTSTHASETQPTVGTEPAATPGRALEDLPLSGPGTFTYAPGSEAPAGKPPHRPYAVATEDGSGVDPVELAQFVEAVLGDKRSWIGDGASGFIRVAEGAPADFTFVVAAPRTVDRLCLPLQTESRYSCGNNGWIALNLFRWETATADWPGTLEVYRQYLVNHEVGHYILGPYHENVCEVPGAPAPIMMQQTIDLLGCAPNGWVYPDRAP